MPKNQNRILTHKSYLKKLTKLFDPNAHMDFAEIEQKWNTVSISPKVPNHIKERIELAFDLFRYSYFNYYFKDVAFLYILITYEAALREAYKVKGITFEQLIDSALNNGLIPPRHYNFKVHSFRKLRNFLAHDSVRPIGVGNQRSILDVVDLINAVYDEEARINSPPIFAQEQLERRRDVLNLKSISKIPENKLKPGDWVYISGGAEKFEKGTYECLFCGKKFILKKDSPSLPLCQNRHCKKDIFRYHPPSIQKS